MSKLLSVLPECYAETILCEILLQVKEVNHQHGKSNVVRRMEKFDFVFLGIVDEDKNKGTQPKYLTEFNILISESDHLKLIKHKTKDQFLIIIKPEIEKWLLNAATVVNVNPTDYQLPSNLKIREITKSKDLNKNTDFRNFIKKLIQEKSEPIIELQTILQHFQHTKLNKNI